MGVFRKSVHFYAKDFQIKRAQKHKYHDYELENNKFSEA